jgi:hypothetical protein
VIGRGLSFALFAKRRIGKSHKGAPEIERTRRISTHLRVLAKVLNIKS